MFRIRKQSLNRKLKLQCFISTTKSKPNHLHTYQPRETLGLSYSQILPKQLDLSPTRNSSKVLFKGLDPKLRIKDEEMFQAIPWSSQYDSVTRNPFAKDLHHLQSLLDALLTSRNFKRADKILETIFEITMKSRNESSHKEYLFALNKYLENYATQKNITVHDLEKYFNESFNGMTPTKDDKTYAILIAKALKDNDFRKYERYLSEIIPYKTLTKNTLSHIDILGVDYIINIIKNKDIEKGHIPENFIPLYEEVYQSNEENENLNKIESISKDLDQLKSVDSFGLKVIRNTLLGLNAETNDSQNLINEMIKDLEKGLNKDFSETGERDYFKLYKFLKTDEERQKYIEALDIFNLTRQKSVELKGNSSALERWKHTSNDLKKRGVLSINKKLNDYLFEWYEQLVPHIIEEAKLCKKVLNGEINIDKLDPSERAVYKERQIYSPYFVLVTPEKMAVVTILELLKLNSSNGVMEGMKTAKALVTVGKGIEVEYKSQKLLDSDNKFVSKKARSSREWDKIIRIIKNHHPNSTNTKEFDEWDGQTHLKIGAVLTKLLLQVAKVTVHGTDPTTGNKVSGLLPAFTQNFEYMKGQKLGVLKVHKKIASLLQSTDETTSLIPDYLPMLSPPKPWTSYNVGGYLSSSTFLVRTKESAETFAYVKAASERNDLVKVYDGLNVLGDTAWTVNRKVLEVITKYWNTGEEFLDIPPDIGEPKLPEPVAPNSEPEVLKDYQRRVKTAVNLASSLKSQRCETNYKLEIARAYVGERMFFPHNVDFRGRAYPISPNFNHLGNDLTRSLFLFWDGKELGNEGLRWLKIHLANLYGIDKVSLDDREKFAEENLNHIFKSAEHPFDENSWWMKGEKPWQVLSACFELNEAYKLSDPTKFISHLPVHQDGSCNGLQHYAALGGDIEGARQVNLVPADRPQDVYSHVAAKVQEKVDEEAAEGNKYAVFLQDKITRKVVKQTVMTNVYGVTFVGASDQIKKQIKHYFSPGDKDELAKHSLYLTTHVFNAIRQLFEGAHKIQDWLGDAAKIISKSIAVDFEEEATSGDGNNGLNHLSTVIWSSPVGLPCVQPYRAVRKQSVATNLQNVVITDPFSNSPIDARKQKTALPPNYVHSLDASHMLMTAASCRELGISFASVHDSYWTHASDIDLLNKKLRQEFVNLHKENLVLKLKEEFEARYKGFLQVINLSRDHELCKKIQDVRKKISKELGRNISFADEISLEKTRRRLLNSDDAEERLQGEQLVTPLSVTEDYDPLSLPQKVGGLQVLVPIAFPEVPKRGDFDVEVVKDSTYFFS
ncbi:DNA-directed RNA polymerase, mitochondrial [[Candida] jaroonii]|uniref:DNA-directed RNA polymerase, mitochondrial n=1 Tax=[Candida] jaroonii TaxID=467808 RepID=A0ACA9YEV3_9ASCO|nr:DNA-directed RNA polymerase, mitochondrial [[Candida] jaroonii]